MVLYVLKEWGNSGPTLNSLWFCSCSLRRCVSDVWDSLGHAGSAASLLFCWRNWFGKYGSDVWNMVLGCLMWIIVELLFTMFIHFLVRPSTWYFCDFLYAFWSLVFIIVKNKVLSLSIIMHYLPIKKSIILKMEFISDCLKEIICVFGSSSNCVCF